MSPIRYCKVTISCPRDMKDRSLDLPYFENDVGRLVFLPFIGCEFSNALEPCPLCIENMTALLANTTYSAISHPINPLSASSDKP